MIFCSQFNARPLLVALILLMVLPVLGQAATLEITGPAGASVVINDRIMGFLPLNQPLTLAPGLYDIKSELTGYLPFETSIVLDEVTDWKRLQIRPVIMSKTTAWTSSLLFAGLGQHYMGKSFKGYFFNAAEAGGLLLAIGGELQRSNYRKDYLLLKDKYDAAINPDDLDYYRRLADEAYANMEDMENRRNTGLLVAGGAIVLSILDAVFLFPGAEVGPGEVPLQTGSVEFDGPGFSGNQNPLQTVHAGYKLEF